MGQADDNPTTPYPYTPPGYRALLAVVTEYGADRVRSWLAEPLIEAFGLDPRGRLYVVGAELWRSDEAEEALRTGTYKNLVVMVRNFDLPPDFVVQWPDQREGFPPPSAEPAEPIEPEPKPAELPERAAPEEPVTPGLQNPEAEPTRHPGGKEPEHDWEMAACHVDGMVDDGVQGRTPLPRNKQSEPIVQRAVDLMKDYFERHDPPPPADRSIRRWITEHPARTRWWWDAE